MLPRSRRSPSAADGGRRRKNLVSNSLQALEDRFSSCSCKDIFWLEETKAWRQITLKCGRPKSELPRRVRTQHDPEVHRRRTATIHGCGLGSGVSFLSGKETIDKKAKFCEVLGPGFCRECTREGSRNENRKEIDEIFWPKSGWQDYRSKTPLYDAIIHRELSPRDVDLDIDSRLKFARLHNFNKAPQYFINPSDGMGMNEKPELTVSGEITEDPKMSGENSTISDPLVVTENDESTQFFRKLSETAASLRHLCKMNKSSNISHGRSSNTIERNTSTSAGKPRSRSSNNKSSSTSFSRLPIEPPLLTIDFANSIMNPEAMKEKLEAALYGTTTLNVPCGPTSQDWE